MAHCHKKHIRLRNFDYASENAYFITIKVKDGRHHLGKVRNGIMGLSEIGNKASLLLQEIPILHPYVHIDKFMVMPNHVHCILEIISKPNTINYKNAYGKPVPGSVSVLINQYKGAVKKWCNENGYEWFQWQKRFHDSVIRDENAFRKISLYIENNPRKWRP
jgi:putative transposase